jgi:hypothetical protein
MDCTRVAELLPWLVNGTLSAEDTRAVRAHLANCVTCQAERKETIEAGRIFGAHVPADALVAYAFDRPFSGGPRDLVDAHLASCPSCAGELQLVRESRTLGLPAVERQPSAAGRPGWWAYAAMAASLTIVATLGGWAAWTGRAERAALAERIAALDGRNRALDAENRRLQQAQSQQAGDVTQLKDQVARLERPQLNAVAVDVFPLSLTERGDRGRTNALTVPAGASVTLLLNSQATARFPQYAIAILDAQGRAVWSGDGLQRGPAGDYTVTLPAGFLTSGRYRIDVFGTDRGERRLADRYALNVTVTPPRP